MNTNSRESVFAACSNFVAQLEAKELQKSVSTNTVYFFVRFVLATCSALIFYYLAYHYFDTLGVKYFTSFLLGLSIAHIGMTSFHELGHHSELKHNRPLRDTLYHYCCSFMGYSGFLWRHKHNYLHHVHTNIISETHTSDPDITLHPINMTQKPSDNKYQKWQHIYSWFLYLVLGLSMQFQSIKFLANNGKVSDKLTYFLVVLLHYTAFFFAPLLLEPSVHIFGQYLVVLFTTSFTLAIIFQMAHVVEETQIYQPEAEDPQEMSEVDWFFHQLETTSNFSAENRPLQYFTGGLTNQVEHHLFPTTSFFHHSEINKFLKQQLDKHNLSHLYKERSFFSALGSHYRALRNGSHKETIK